MIDIFWQGDDKKGMVFDGIIRQLYYSTKLVFYDIAMDSILKSDLSMM